MTQALMTQAIDDRGLEAELAKLRALAAKEQERIDDLEDRNRRVASEMCTSLTVTGSAFGMGFLREYLDEDAKILGVPVDAGVGLLLHGFAALLGLSFGKTAKKVAKVLHDVAHGALASWANALGAELGVKKRKTKRARKKTAPQPITQLDTGADAPQERAPRPMTHEELAALKVGLAGWPQPPVASPASTPAPSIPQPAMAPVPAPQTAPAARPRPVPAPPQAASTESAKSEANVPPSASPKKPFRFTHRANLLSETAEGRTRIDALAKSALPSLESATEWFAEQVSTEKWPATLRMAGVKK